MRGRGGGGLQQTVAVVGSGWPRSPPPPPRGRSRGLPRVERLQLRGGAQQQTSGVRPPRLVEGDLAAEALGAGLTQRRPRLVLDRRGMRNAAASAPDSRLAAAAARLRSARWRRVAGQHGGPFEERGGSEWATAGPGAVGGTVRSDPISSSWVTVALARCRARRSGSPSGSVTSARAACTSSRSRVVARGTPPPARGDGGSGPAPGSRSAPISPPPWPCPSRARAGRRRPQQRRVAAGLGGRKCQQQPGIRREGPQPLGEPLLDVLDRRHGPRLREPLTDLDLGPRLGSSSRASGLPRLSASTRSTTRGSVGRERTEPRRTSQHRCRRARGASARATRPAHPAPAPLRVPMSRTTCSASIRRATKASVWTETPSSHWDVVGDAQQRPPLTHRQAAGARPGRPGSARAAGRCRGRRRRRATPEGVRQERHPLGEGAGRAAATRRRAGPSRPRRRPREQRRSRRRSTPRVEQRRLADAGLAAHHQDAASPLTRTFEQVTESWAPSLVRPTMSVASASRSAASITRRCRPVDLGPHFAKVFALAGVASPAAYHLLFA